MTRTDVTWAGLLDTFLLLLIGIGPKLVLVPLIQLTAPLDPAVRARVVRRMLTIGASTAVVLVLVGELLRRLLHFSVGALSIAGGVVLFVLALAMIAGRPSDQRASLDGGDPMRMAAVPLAIPYLLNPVGIVALVTISSEAASLAVVASELAVLALVLVIDVVVFRVVGRRSSPPDETRMLIVEMVFGFLIAAIGVQLVLDGLVSTDVIPHALH